MSRDNDGATFEALLPSEFWDDLSVTVGVNAVVERPFEEITIYRDAETDAYHGCVTKPLPELPRIDDEDADSTDDDDGFISNDVDWDAREENEPVKLVPGVAAAVGDLVEGLRDEITVTSPEEGTIETEFVRVVVEDGAVAATFRVVRSLPPECSLYDEFRELMVTLGHVDEPGEVTHGSGLQPETWEERHHDRPVDLGMAATAYQRVPDPHTYWRDCETLDDYIEMCVENGADRAELEARDEYYHHFHPQTTYRELQSNEEDALTAWRDEVQRQIDPFVTVSGPELVMGVSDVAFEEDGSGTVVLSVSLGDEISR